MTLTAAFDDFQNETCALLSEAPDAGFELEFQLGDVIHHMHAALVWFEGTDAPSWDTLDEARRILAHEAHHSLIAFARVLRDRERVPSDASDAVIARVGIAVDGLLDALEPFVTRADRELRRCLLEGQSLEAALERLAVR